MLFKIVQGHIEKIITLFLEAPSTTDLEVEVTGQIKLLFCRSV